VNERALELPFDQYQRYRLVADLLAQLRAGGRRLEVLDVGGRTGVLRDFVEGARVTLVDLEPAPQTRLVLGDGSRLPFEDRAFDAVCAFDTLEHVPPPRRRAFVGECRRVARRWVVLAGPYEHPKVVEAEELLQRFLADKLGERHRYLDEHRHHGLPVRGEVEEQLRALGGRVVSVGHANLERWLALQCLSMALDYDPALRGLARDFQRFYNAELYASDHAEPVYRHAVVAAFEDAPVPDRERLLGPPRAPAGALGAVLDLGVALAHFDRERERWRKERAAFEKTAAELRADLEQHRRTVTELLDLDAAKGRGIAALERALAEHERGAEQSIEALRKDLDGHRTALADAKSEARAREEELTNLRADLEGHRRLVAELRADLQGHRELAAGLSRDLDGHRKALENERAEGERARADAQRLRAELEESRAKADLELRQALALATGLEQSIARRELVYDELQAELRSRWKNLLRVFRPG
jgi:hypothetical protein